MRNWDEWGVPKIELVNAKRHGNCRGKDCNHAVKIGERVLRIHVASTRGNYTSFFCEKCMMKMLPQLNKVVEELNSL